MAQTYFAIFTAVGEAKDANAKALGIPMIFTEMAVGDGNGALPVPDRTRTTLVNQVRRAPLNQLSRDPVNMNQVIAEQVIPENVGGWWVREIGLYDVDGDLIAIANCPPTYKPQLAEGSGRTQVVRMVLIVSSADTVQLKIDPAVVLATRKYADDAITASMNAHLEAANPHPAYALKTGIQSQLYKAFTTTGAAPTFALTPTPAPDAYAAGLRFRVKFNVDGNGSDTLNISVLGAKSLKQLNNSGVKVAAVIRVGQLADIEYDGVDLVILNPISTARAPGTIFMHGGGTAPSGSMICPTSATNVSRTTYAALFAAIGTAWGVGDGATTFGIPFFPADYAPVQANANVGTATVGEVIAHFHGLPFNGRNNTAGGNPNLWSGVTNDVQNSATVGGAANLAAGKRVLICVQF